MKLKSLLVLLALGLTGSLAVAGPITFGKSGLNGNFSDSHDFSLSSGQQFSGSVLTTSMLEGDINISSVVLSNGQMEYRFEKASDFQSITSASSSVDIKGHSMLQWTQTYALTPLFLSAGDWHLTVTGYDNDSNKFNGSYSASLDQAGSTVPEPQTLGLVLGAFGAMALVSRRKRGAAVH